MPKPNKPVDPWETPDPALALALQELDRYSQRRLRARTWSRFIECVLLLTTAATTLAAALHATAWITASLGTGSVILTGLRNIFPYREYWATYATAWSRLRTAMHEYRLLPEDRRDQDARRRLVRRIDEIVGAEIEERASQQRMTSE